MAFVNKKQKIQTCCRIPEKFFPILSHFNNGKEMIHSKHRSADPIYFRQIQYLSGKIRLI